MCTYNAYINIKEISILRKKSFEEHKIQWYKGILLILGRS